MSLVNGIGGWTGLIWIRIKTGVRALANAVIIIIIYVSVKEHADLQI